MHVANVAYISKSTSNAAVEAGNTAKLVVPSSQLYWLELITIC